MAAGRPGCLVNMAASSDKVVRVLTNSPQDPRFGLGIPDIIGVDAVVVCAKLECDTENTERDLCEGSVVSTENIPRLEGTGYLPVGTSGVDVGSGYQSPMLFD